MPIGKYDHYKVRGRGLPRRAPRKLLYCIDCGKEEEFYVSELKRITISSERWLGCDDKGIPQFYRCRKCHCARVRGNPRPKEVCEKISASKQGVSFSDEHKQNLSISAQKRPTRTKCFPCTEETKEKLRLVNLGKTIPEDVRQKISRTMSYRLRTIERKNGYVSGWFVSRKFNSKMFYRSSFEKRALEIFEELDSVVFLKSESCVLPYVNEENKLRHYVVDYHLQLGSGEEFLVEVKPSGLLNDSLNLLKFAAAREWARSTGMFFCILTENELIGVNSVETTLMKEISLVMAAIPKG